MSLEDRYGLIERWYQKSRGALDDEYDRLRRIAKNDSNKFKIPERRNSILNPSLLFIIFGTAVSVVNALVVSIQRGFSDYGSIAILALNAFLVLFAFICIHLTPRD